MSNKKHFIRSPKIFLPDQFQTSENEHILEHVHFLEERVGLLEHKVETLREVFTTMLELDDDTEDEDEEVEELED